MSDYIFGTDIIIGVAVFPSVSVYPISAAQDMLDEVDTIVGEILGTGPMLWPRGNFDFDVESAVARLAARRDVDDFEDIIGAPAVYKGPAYFEGSDEDLLAQLDLERRWDESFDEAMLRRSGGSMRGGSR